MKNNKIYLNGVIILIGAILVNFIAKYLGILTWYDFLNDIREANLVDYIFLFLIYPFSLGSLAYFGNKFLVKIVFNFKK